MKKDQTKEGEWQCRTCNQGVTAHGERLWLKENWEIEFDKVFGELVSDKDNNLIRCTEGVKTFIRQLREEAIQTLKKEIISALEKEKKPKVFNALIGREITVSEGDDGFNQALDSAIEIIKKS